MSLRCAVLFVLGVSMLVAIQGCADHIPADRAENNIPADLAENDIPLKEEKQKTGCRITGRVVSTAWRQMGGGIERAIVTAERLPGWEHVETVYAKGEPFELRLPPGKYRLICSANGTRGATFLPQAIEVNVDKDRDIFELGEIDLPISKTTGLYGQPAPELTGIIGWQNTQPISITDLRGKVIVLDFFAYTCSICHAHKPDLEKLRKQHERDGLVVLAIHDSTLKTLDEMNTRMEPLLRHVFDGHPPKLPMALDGAGENSVCEAYGIHAVPAVILIDQQGRIIRRYHHAGVPELAADVQSLLRASSGRIQ